MYLLIFILFLTYLTNVHVGKSPIIGLFPKMICILDLLNSQGTTVAKKAAESTKVDRVFVP